MTIRPGKKTRIDIAESGALSDLAFLLIVFFIVIAVFNVNSGFILGLPRKDSTKILNVKDIINVTLQADGSFHHKDNAVSLTEVENLVSRRLEVRPNMTFLLVIHPEVSYQAVVEVVDIVRKLDVENFSFRIMDISP